MCVCVRPCVRVWIKRERERVKTHRQTESFPCLYIKHIGEEECLKSKRRLSTHLKAEKLELHKWGCKTTRPYMYTQLKNRYTLWFWVDKQYEWLIWRFLGVVFLGKHNDFVELCAFLGATAVYSLGIIYNLSKLSRNIITQLLAFINTETSNAVGWELLIEAIRCYILSLIHIYVIL